MASSNGSGDFSSKMEEPEHPLLNFVVLRVLFDHASFEEFNNYRSVCKTWWDVSLRRWRKDSTVTFRDGPVELLTSVEKFMIFWKVSQLLPDQSYLDKYPFKKYCLRGWNIDMENDATFLFWKKLGATMSHLEMRGCKFDSLQDFRTILFGSVPKLEVLHYNLTVCSIPAVNQRSLGWNGELIARGINENLREFKYTIDKTLPTELAVSLEEFFCHMPNMKALVFNPVGDNYEAHRPWDLNTLLEAIQSIRASHNIRIQLQSLNLVEQRNFWLLQHHYNLLRTLRFPLTSLSLVHEGESTTQQVLFQQIIGLHCQTLRKIYLVRVDYTRDVFEHSPFKEQFDSLQELIIFGGCPSRSLEFLEFTPKLRRLLVVDNIYSDRELLDDAAPYLSINKEEIQNLRNKGRLHYDMREDLIGNTNFANLKTCPCLEEFVYKQGGLSCTPLQVRNLTKLMPNLKVVQIGLSSPGFKIACEGWKNLEVLLVGPWRIEVEHCGFSENITKLKHLRYFAMAWGIFWNCDDGYELCEQSIVEGLLKCQRLEKIWVVCSEKVITNKYIHA
ncbi:unnamed protein product [Orchesella dallaii]|uniref:F-box domain-containing protein n=1 Tax=Orchesella dallaii TaxID=48710 RepID=A0ABP1RMB8_9HEXA